MRGIRSNPFVVLADITIALCFIFAVYAVLAAGQRVFTESTRDQRQESLEKELRDVISRWYYRNSNPLITGQQDVTGLEKDQGLRSVLTVAKDRSRKIAFYGNSSFQRVSFYDPYFRVGDNEFVDTAAKDLYLELGQILKRRRADFQYIYLHGFAEESEVRSYNQSARAQFLRRTSRRELREVARRYGLNPGSLSVTALVSGILEAERPEWLRKLSVERANAIYQLWESSGAVGKPSVQLADNLDPRFVIPYGTGSKLYQRPEMGVGRVDLVLFFGDLTDEQKAKAKGGG